MVISAVCAFSREGSTLASGESSSGSSVVILWDVATGSLRNTLRHSTDVSSVAFSSDGGTLASGSAGVFLWDVATGSLKNVLETDRFVRSIVYSPDGSTLASGGDSGIHLWDAATGNLINTFEGSSYVYSLAYSPDGRTLAGGSWRGVHLWDATTGNRIDTFEYPNRIDNVAFGPDGRTLASVGGDQTVRLWDAATGTLINTLTGHRGTVNSVAFSPNGQYPRVGEFRRHGAALAVHTPAHFHANYRSLSLDDCTHGTRQRWQRFHECGFACNGQRWCCDRSGYSNQWFNHRRDRR